MKNISLKNKILILAGFMTVVSMTVGAVSYWSSNKSVKKFEELWTAGA